MSDLQGAPGVSHRAIDAHAHVFDLQRYPFHPSSGFSLLPNEPGTAHQYAAVLDCHGMSHALLVNPLGGYGVDNRNMLAVIAAGNGRFKGVAVVPHEVSERELDAMLAGGVVGIRFNLGFPTSPTITGPGGARLLAMAAERGMFAQVHYHESAHLMDVLPILLATPATLVFDHGGRPELARGLAQPAFQALLEIGRGGRAYVKLSALFRSSQRGWPYEDMDPYVQALIQAFTLQRCMWGSDWPFLRARTRIDYGPELAVVARWLPNAADRDTLFWGTPAPLLGFA